MEGQHPRPKKSLGQNFLQDRNVARRIVEQLRVRPDDRVLEIGPGPGMLTGFLRSAGPAALYLVEKDYYWAQERQKDRAGEGPPAQVILADALGMPWEKFTGPWKIVGNLPYNVASPLIWDILSLAVGLSRAVFMVQKEVGLRLKDGAGSGAYGALSVWVQSFAVPRLEFIVPPQVFKPSPKVHSAVLSFAPLPQEDRPRRPQELSRLLKICFQQRRKQLGTVFRAASLAVESLEELGIKPTARAEELTPLQFQALSERVF